jgi:hypothetical protein
MSDRDLIDAVARNTGEDSHEIRRRGFVLTGSKIPRDPSKRRAGSVVEVPEPRPPTPVAFSLNVSGPRPARQHRP